MQGRSSRERFLIIVCVLFVPALLLWNVFTPSGGAGKKQAMVPKDEALRQRNVAIKQITQLESQDNDLEASIAKMSYTLPAEDLIPRVIRDLQSIAAKAGVHLREVKPLRAKALPLGAGSRVSMEVQFKAAFEPDVVRFLYFVEEPGGKRVVDKLNITSADARFKTVDVSAQVTVFTRSAAGVAPAEGVKGNAPVQPNRS